MASEQPVVMIKGDSPLSIYHQFKEGLPLGNDISVKSLAEGYYYIMLIMHRDQPENVGLAQNLLKTSMPAQEIGVWLDRHGFRVNAGWAVECDRVYADIIAHQWEKNSVWMTKFRSVLQDAGSPTPKFLICTNRNDFVLATGCREKQLVDNQFQFPGMNLYGEVLTEFARNLHSSEHVIYNYPDFPDLKVDPAMISCRKYVLLIISDSISKYFGAIQHGRVIPLSGATTGHLADVLKASQIDLADYEYIIVQAGVNDARKLKEHDQEAGVGQMMDLLMEEGSKRGGSTSFALFSPEFAHPDEPRSYEHHAKLTSWVKTYGFRVVEWSELNPFVNEDGQLDAPFFNKNRFGGPGIHFNHKGSGLLWKVWCKYIPPLARLNILLTRKPYQQDCVDQASVMPQSKSTALRKKRKTSDWRQSDEFRSASDWKQSDAASGRSTCFHSDWRQSESRRRQNRDDSPGPSHGFKRQRRYD